MTRRAHDLLTAGAVLAFAVCSVGLFQWVCDRHMADCPGFSSDGHGRCGWCWCPNGAYDGSDFLHDFSF